MYFLSESEESDGWETVQRGGKAKTKTSPNQRSLENLHTVSRPEHKLTRSVSDPNACIEKYHKKVNGKGRGKLPTKKSLMNESQSRPRTDSKDSEKENRPDVKTLKSEVTVTTEIVASENELIVKTKTEPKEPVPNLEQSKSKLLDRPAKSSPTVRKSYVRPTNSDKSQTKTSDKNVGSTVSAKAKVDDRSQIKGKGPSSSVRQNAWAKPLNVSDKEVKEPAKNDVTNKDSQKPSAENKSVEIAKEKQPEEEEGEITADEKSDPVDDELEDAIDDVSKYIEDLTQMLMFYFIY